MSRYIIQQDSLGYYIIQNGLDPHLVLSVPRPCWVDLHGGSWHARYRSEQEALEHAAQLFPEPPEDDTQPRPVSAEPAVVIT